MADTERQTKRRYAHELYPHAEEGMTRPLSAEVPYRYAQAIGLNTSGSGWFERWKEGEDSAQLAVTRTESMIDARLVAFLTDALLQGLTSDEAWQWADERTSEESGEFVYERAIHFGVPYGDIKPYPCGDEPVHHNHLGKPDAQGFQRVTRVDGRESDCLDCTEPVSCVSTPSGDASEVVTDSGEGA